MRSVPTPLVRAGLKPLSDLASCVPRLAIFCPSYSIVACPRDAHRKYLPPVLAARKVRFQSICRRSEVGAKRKYSAIRQPLTQTLRITAATGAEPTGIIVNNGAVF